MDAAPLSRSGVLFVLSAPSGAGKSTLCRELSRDNDFIYSVSCTTRKPRPGEVHGKDYYFLSHAEFEELIARGEFLEYAEVHGNYYGTRRDIVLDALLMGTDVLIDIDVQGAAQIRANPHPEIRRAHVDIFMMPPSFEVLEERLRKRGTDTEEQIALRLRNARKEMEAWKDYRYTIVSHTVEGTYREFRAIMTAERAASKRLRF